MSPLTSLDKIYKIPDEYDFYPKINLKLSSDGYLCIEGNQKFKIIGSNNGYEYYDSLIITKPDTSLNYFNKIYLKFQYTRTTDSIYYVVSKSPNAGIFWNQIFYSSVRIQFLNKFSSDPVNFRKNTANLISENLLKDNDTLIEQVTTEFNNNINSYNLISCGIASKILKSICDKYNLPCNIITLQGGDSFEAGYDIMIGFPLHIVCEIYTSKYKKWFVIDPLNGIVFRMNGRPLNAAEISNIVFFNWENNIFQDSVLASYRTNLKGDYFKVYENIYYDSDCKPNFIAGNFLKYFYGKYRYSQLHYSNNIPNNRKGNLYIERKSIMYIIIVFVYVNLAFIIISLKLYHRGK